MRVSGNLLLGSHQQLNEKRIELLRRIDQLGSLSAAAKAVGLSYKGAWDAIDAINNLSDQELVCRVSGGRGGGGSTLTTEGKKILQMYDLFADAHERFMEDLSRHSENPQDAYIFLRRMSMKTSARNQFGGEIISIRHGSVNDEVTLKLGGGDEITAIITRDSVKNMELSVGKKAYALIKASSVILADEKPHGISARNILSGTIERIVLGGVNAEVILALPGQTRLAAVVTRESISNLELREGAHAWAFFKASSVILGV
ncbi:TOBE domain-containing protein [Pelovirga terrestris]|uniref:TOBE domain-containing protein n=1 Tax=Pelovirga terrestris TaxID=2771352 RepID=A0A8J6QPW5_9BACT|nr:TOBE domain-containing protein [Pelovirga terrestris]MBD1399730.1 TOBE domain-containing protein [Pelovirga terrestris]